MAIKSGFFNSVSGDRKYNADDMSSYFSGLISKGIVKNYLSSFVVTASGSTMQVTVKPGKAYFSDGKYVESDASILQTISIADSTQPRIDRIVLSRDLNSSKRTVELLVLKGTPSSNPQPPEVQNDDNIEQLSLCQVRVNKGVTYITQSNITDERNTNLCGFVHGLIDQIDTEDLFLQYDDAFNSWFNVIKDQLGEDAAGNLQLQVNEIKENYTPKSDIEPDTTTTQKTIGGWNVNYIKIGYKQLYVRISKTFTGGLARQDHVKQSITLPFSTVREYKLHATLMVGWALDSRPALGYIDGTEFWITTAEAITNDITFEAFGVISVEEDV